MERDLEKFVGGPNKPAQSRMRVTLTKTNRLSFNRNTFRQIGKPLALYLYFSRVRDVIAIEPVHSLNFSAAFPVLEARGSHHYVNAAPFCRHFGISLDTTVRFISPELRDNKLELKLNETISVAQVRRKRKQ
ncbi:MAG: hypothetical protein LC730_03915 [Acidobacteria bacterium]|nr:hypothetical protein [Acidobacteriota bacterium]MCA1608593.1 hypothetical protein [Acidobacteriota bacterium]